jgi:hypothetical protein
MAFDFGIFDGARGLFEARSLLGRSVWALGS